MPSSDARFTKDPNFIPRTIAGERILVPLTRVAGQPDALFVLNDTGGFIWEQVSPTTTVAQMRDRLVDRFAVDPEQAAQDLNALLEQLAAIGAIQPAP